MGTSATVRLIEGVLLIRCPLNTGFTVYGTSNNSRDLIFLKIAWSIYVIKPERDNEINPFFLDIFNKRGDEWSIKIFNCSQNFTFARFAHKI